MTGIPNNPANITPIPSRPALGNGSKYVRMYSAPLPGTPEPTDALMQLKLAAAEFLGKLIDALNLPPTWMFAHRENAKGAVHAFTVINKPDGSQTVQLLVTRRPPLGGRLSIELPAGLIGDEDNKGLLETANKEVEEETGYTPQASRMLAPNMFATSAGLTSEQKAFAIAQVSGEPKTPDAGETEQHVIVDRIEVPLRTFLEYDRFTAWLKQMDETGYVVGAGVIAARGLLPPASADGRLDLQA